MTHQTYRRAVVSLFLLLSAFYQQVSAQQLGLADSLTLRKLWMALDGPNWNYPTDLSPNQYWFKTPSSSTYWQGVTVSGGFVTSLTLMDYMVPPNGTVHYDKLKALSKLVDLTINYAPQVNTFSPDSLTTYLSNLGSFTFSGNQAKGTLPSKFFAGMANLKTLNLSNNLLSDTIPWRAIGNAKLLETLSLSSNQFTGAFDTYALNLGASGNSNYKSLYIDNNSLTKITNQHTFVNSGKTIYLYLNNNQINDEGGFLKKLYQSTASLLSSSSIISVSYNQLNNSSIASSLALNTNYYQTPSSGSVIVLPQILGAESTIDIASNHLNSLTVAYNVKDDNYNYSNILYTVADNTYSGSDITYVKNSLGNASLTFQPAFLQDYLANNKQVVIQPYITNDPYNSQHTGYSVMLAPITLRIYDIAAFTLIGHNAMICKSNTPPTFNYTINALGVHDTDVCVVQIAQTTFNGAVKTNTTFNLSSTQIATLLKNKTLDLSMTVSGDSVTLKLNKVTLNGTAVAISDSSNTTIISTPNSKGKTTIIPESKYFCKNVGSFSVKIVHPETGVDYNIPQLGESTAEYLTKDTILIWGGPQFNDSDAKFALDVYAYIDDKCETVLFHDSINIRTGDVTLPTDPTVTDPTCTTDAIINLSSSNADYSYTPILDNVQNPKYLKYGNVQGQKLSITLPVYEFKQGTSLGLFVADRYCSNSGQQMSLEYVYYADTLPLKATDSMAVVHFVERVGFYPTSNSDAGGYEWYGRSIFNINAYEYLPLNQWYDNYGDLAPVKIVCGRVTELDLNSEAGNKIYSALPFKLDFDSLTELRHLDLGYNGFTGTFDAPNIIKSTKLNYVDVSNNNFADESFANFKQQLTGISVYAQNNYMTFVSLLHVHPGGQDYKVMPQNTDISIDTTVYEGIDFNYSNPIPDTKDGKLVYHWYRDLDGSRELVSTTRDLTFPKIDRTKRGNYYCVLQHPAFQTMSYLQQFVMDSMVVWVYLDVTICDASSTDSLALVTFYNGLKTKPKWDLTKPVKTWSGITFECANVAEIRLSNQKLAGPILGLDQLRQLVRLDLSHNNLDSLGFNLGDLPHNYTQYINLANNNIKDAQDHDFYPYNPEINLDTLIIANNSFTGSFSFTNFTPIYIDAHHNKISYFEVFYDPNAGVERLGQNERVANPQQQGRIANDFNYDFRTTYLDLSTNALTSTQFALGDSTSLLKHLNLSNNQLTGTLGNITLPDSTLQYLNIANNALTGTLTNLSHLLKLDTLILAHNQLSGTLGLINLWKVADKPMKYLDLGNNFLYGAVPDSFALLKNLQYLALDSNVYNFSGTTTSQKITSLPSLSTSLKQLHVESNSLNFGDLKAYKGLGNQLTWFPQDSLTTNKPVKAFGQDSLVIYDAGIANSSDAAQTYQWFRVKLDGTTEKWNTSQKLTIANAQKADIGYYYASVKYAGLGPDSLITTKFFVNITHCKLNIMDSLAMLHFYKNTKMQMPSTFKANDVSTWPGVTTDCQYITEIRLPNRNLSGTLSGMDSLQYLEVLDLSNNTIKTYNLNLGSVIGHIRVVKLRNNHMQFIQGLSITLPTDVKNVADTLDLSGNHILYMSMYGAVPKYVDISNDSIQSLYIQALYNNPTMEYVDVSHNLLTQPLAGSYSSILDTVITSSKLRHIDLSYNQLSGTFTIPKTFGLLQYLDVSHNNLTLGSGTSKLKTCTALQYLNIGNNNFLGAYIDTLTTLSQLQYFAVDSNSLSHTESNSGITALPLLPSNTGMQLFVQDNHLDFMDLEPYASLLNTSNKYVPQYDSIDNVVSIKPAVGSYISLTTSLAGSQTQYSWLKSTNKSAFTSLTKPTANEKTLKFAFALADTGKYSVAITNTSFPGLTFYRRPITLQPCGVAYTILYQSFHKANKCKGTDTLDASVTYVTTKLPVTRSTLTWYFNDKVISQQLKNKIPLYVSGSYYYSVNDLVSGCLITSKDTLINTDAYTSPSIGYAPTDSSLHLLNSYTTTPKFQWMINGLPIAGAHNSTLRVYYNGNYQLAVIQNDSCTGTSKYLEIKDFTKTFVRTEHVLNDQGQVVLNSLEQLQVFPNPATDFFTVSGILPGSFVTINNVHGDVLWQGIAQETSLNISANAFAKGIYLLNVTLQNTSKWEKIVIK